MGGPAIELARACTTAVGALALLALSTFATADITRAQVSAIRHSCEADFDAHCKDGPTRGQGALDCLQRNASVVSAACQRALAAAGSTGGSQPAPEGSVASTPATGAPGAKKGSTSARQEKAVVRICKADFNARCAGTPVEGGLALACLKANASELSPSCQSALKAAKL